MRLECETSFYNDEKLDTDLTHAQETADEAKEAAEQAAGTAKNYLYNSENKGLVVSRTKVESDAEVEALTTPNSRVTADGFDVYKNGTARTAHFGETTIIGESQTPQIIIRNNTFVFTSNSGSSVFNIINGVSGSSSKFDYFEVDEGYLNSDGTLNTTALANIIDAATSGYEIMSADGDHVTTTDGASLVVELSGYGFDSNDNGTSTMSVASTMGCTKSIINESIVATATSEYDPSDWTPTIDEFVALFPSGTKNYKLYLKITLYYTISDVVMTLGTRVENETFGARSVSMGSNNIASGTGSVAIGKDLIVTDDYSMIVGESNLPIENAGTGDHMPTAFAVGANNTTPFAVLKNGIIVMSAVNSGQSPQRAFGAFTRTDIRIDFQYEYPTTPFVFLTLNEDNVPNNQNDITDYGRIQIYKKAVDTTGFTATVVNGSDTSHTFNFSWFAISVL